jgi:hypothetical protein
MAKYRVPELDLSTRQAIAMEMLQDVKERGWGRVTELAEKHQVSRTLLYQIRDLASAALTEALAPNEPGPQPKTQMVEVNEALVRRAIMVLPMVQGSVRDIQTGLELLLGVERSVGFIHGTLQEVAEKAAAYNAERMPTRPVLGEADEIFCGGKPCLTVVDGDSFVVLNISAAERRDETTWGLKFLELLEQGVDFHDLAADGALGIKAGMEAAQLGVPLRPDLFHLMQDSTKITNRLERQAESAMKATEKAWRALDHATSPKPGPGRRTSSTLTLEEAQAVETIAIDTADNWSWLLDQLRSGLEPITPAGRIASADTIRETMEAIAGLMQELERTDVAHFATTVLDKLNLFLAPIIALEETLAPWRIDLNADTEATIVRAWLQKEELCCSVQELFPPSLLPIAQAFWDALSRFHRSSSLAEAFHAWLRPFLQRHRSLPDWLAALLQLFWNNHRFQRGKRAGHSPLELATGMNLPDLSQIIDLLLEEQPKPIA